MNVAMRRTEAVASLGMSDLARITVDQYEEFARLGTLADPGVELVNGLLMRKTAKRPRHSAVLVVIEDAPTLRKGSE